MAGAKPPRITTTKQGSSTGGTLPELSTATIAKVNLLTLKCRTVGKSSYKLKETKTASFSRTV
jgi:hypothetical protein